MIDLWLAIALCMLIVILTIYYSVSQFVKHHQVLVDETADLSTNTNTSNTLLLIPIGFLFISIFLYSQNPSVELHENWLNTQIETKNSIHVETVQKGNLTGGILDGNGSSQDMQSMLLGLRS